MISQTESIQIGSRKFQRYGKTYVMGILNVTPDSFFDGGKWDNQEKALYRVEDMLAEGMDILDIGGESTRPGYKALSVEEEINRVIPVIEAVKRRFNLPVSLDTCKSEVADAGISAGVDMINDIWGLKYDADMANTIARGGVACCLAHNRKEASYRDLLGDVTAELGETIRLAEQAGISRERIILDPGIGFGKTYEQNLELINSLEQIRAMGYPVLLGCSRKSVIGRTLDLPADECLEGTLVTTVFGVLKGCSFVRVHDIRENVRAVRMAEALLYNK